MIRPGHHAPLGSVATMRFPEWTFDREPHLSDVALDTGRQDERHEPADVRRAYLVVGIEEMRLRPGRPPGFRLRMERIEWLDWYATAGLEGEPGIWTFVHV